MNKTIVFILLNLFLLINAQENINYENKNEFDSVNNNLAIQIFDINCNDNDQCNDGLCIRQKCSCNYGKISVLFLDKNNSTQITPCNYALKKQSNAFFFELLLGFGIGHFYSERVKHGLLKFFAYVSVLLCFVIYPLLVKKLLEKQWNFTLYFSVILLFSLVVLLFAFYISDLINFSKNNFKDGYGFDMIPWS